MRKTGLAAMAMLAALASAPQAQAQTPEGWAFAVTPYVWFSGISGTASVNTRNQGTITESATADFNNIFDSMRFAAMGSAEIRYGRFGVVADFIFLDLSEGVNTGRDPRYSGGSSSVQNLGLGLAALYRVVDAPGGWLDVGAGIRPWWVDTSITLNPGRDPIRDPGRSASRNFSWTDPIIAVRGQIRLAPQFSLTGYADIGGFGAGSRLTYQLLATADWNATNWLTISAGYRQLAFDFENGRGKLDLTIGGPILAASFRF